LLGSLSGLGCEEWQSEHRGTGLFRGGEGQGRDVLSLRVERDWQTLGWIWTKSTTPLGRTVRLLDLEKSLGSSMCFFLSAWCYCSGFVENYTLAFVFLFYFKYCVHIGSKPITYPDISSERPRDSFFCLFCGSPFT